MNETTATGRCHCGAVRFTITAETVGVIACHCRDCQQMHGNYNVMLAAPRAAVAIEGEPAWYASSDKARRGFCGTCGSRLFKDILGGDRLLVSAGVVDPPTGKRIIRNIWEQSKGDWYELPPLDAPADQKR
jgi:hypothetical protein